MAKFGHIDKRLTDFSIQYNQSEFHADKVFPEQPVIKGSDKFLKYKKGNLFQDVNDVLGKDGEAGQLQFATEDDTYSVQDYGLKDYVTPEDVANADDPLKPEADTVENLTSTILLKREIRGKAVADSMSVNTATPGVKWSFGAGDPVVDIEAGANAMFRRPNTMIISRPVFDQMKFNVNLLNKIGGGSTNLQMADIGLLRTLFGIPNIFVADAKKDANRQPLSASLSFVWGKSVLLAFVDPRNSVKIITFGRLFAQLINGATFSVRTWDEPSKGRGGRKAIQVEHGSVAKLISEDFGYHITDAIA